MSKPHYEWARAEERALARFLQPASLPAEFRWPTYVNRLDLLQAEGPTGVAGQLFGLMRKAAIQYDLAPFNPRSGVTQLIRKPATILAEKRGTCLDLVALFATMCLANDLLPIVVVVDGHTFAGLSLTRTRQDARRAPKALAWERGELTDPSVLQALAGTEYLYVECTGAAQSQALSPNFPEGRGRGSAGSMSFERACEAGSEQVLQHLRLENATGAANQRAFLYALDIHDLQVNQGFEPLADDADAAPPAGPVGARAQTQTGSGNIQFGDNAQIDGDVFTGGKRVINTGGGSYYAGPIDVGGDFVGGNKTITQQAGGDIIGRDKVTTTDSRPGGDLTRVFEQIYQQVEARPEDKTVDKEEITATLRRIEQETAKGDAASEPRLSRWLEGLGRLAPDILDAAAAALSGPSSAISAVVRRVAERARQRS